MFQDSTLKLMTAFLEQLRLGWIACGVERGETVVLAVSGGADSVGLLCGTDAIADDLNLRIVVAHFNHRMRGRASDRDADWVRRTAWRIADSVIVESAPTLPAGVQASEESARDLRYTFLKEAAQRYDSRFVAVAHTADDQAETILHHILRGTGITGLRGIPRTRLLSDRITLIRPMLEMSRADIVDWLGGRRQAFRHDASNKDARFTRNRIRNILIPQLAADFNPQIVQALLRLGRQVVDTDEALKKLAEQALHQCQPKFSADGLECVLSIRGLADWSRHVRRGMFVLLWTQLGWPRQRMDYNAWDALASLADRAQHAEGAGDQIHLPGSIRAVVRQGDVELIRRPTRDTKSVPEPE